jgi:signal transduction histidine kinase
MSDRLERIEAALDRQAEVNADLRTSVVELRASTQELRATAEALLSTVQIHQQNFEVLATRFNTLTERQVQTDAQLEEYQRTTSAALDRIGSVLDYLVKQNGHSN